MTGMIGISCARDDKNVRPDHSHMTYHLIDSVLGMDGDNDASRLQYAAGFEECRISRITVVNQMAFTAVTGDGGSVDIGRDVFDPVLPK